MLLNSNENCSSVEASTQWTEPIDSTSDSKHMHGLPVNKNPNPTLTLTQTLRAKTYAMKWGVLSLKVYLDGLACSGEEQEVSMLYE